MHRPRWYRWEYGHLKAALRERMNKKFCKKTEQKHFDLGKSRMQRGESDVRNVKDCIGTWIPSLYWHREQEITNIPLVAKQLLK